jgi:hypothetical protein
VGDDLSVREFGLLEISVVDHQQFPYKIDVPFFQLPKQTKALFFSNAVQKKLYKYLNAPPNIEYLSQFLNLGIFSKMTNKPLDLVFFLASKLNIFGKSIGSNSSMMFERRIENRFRVLFVILMLGLGLMLKLEPIALKMFNLCFIG